MRESMTYPRRSSHGSITPQVHMHHITIDHLETIHLPSFKVLCTEFLPTDLSCCSSVGEKVAHSHYQPNRHPTPLLGIELKGKGYLS